MGERARIKIEEEQESVLGGRVVCRERLGWKDGLLLKFGAERGDGGLQRPARWIGNDRCCISVDEKGQRMVGNF